MTIVFTNSTLGTVSWALPENINERLETLRAAWKARGQEKFADEFEARLQEDITRFLVALTGALSAALNTNKPSVPMAFINEHMEALLVGIAEKIKEV